MCLQPKPNIRFIYKRTYLCRIKISYILTVHFDQWRSQPKILLGAKTLGGKQCLILGE